LHDKLVGMQRDIRRFLVDTTFDMFRAASQDHGLKPTPSDTAPTGPRESYRAVERRKR
jgi:hypothetical protein